MTRILAPDLLPDRICSITGRLGDGMIKFEIFWTIARSIFGLFFFATGLWIWVHILTGIMPEPIQPTARAQAFTDALDATGFMNALLSLSYLAGGAALLIMRTAPLGLVLLGPSVVVIFFFHLEP